MFCLIIPLPKDTLILMKILKTNWNTLSWFLYFQLSKITMVLNTDILNEHSCTNFEVLYLTGHMTIKWINLIPLVNLCSVVWLIRNPLNITLFGCKHIYLSVWQSFYLSFCLFIYLWTLWIDQIYLSTPQVRLF